MSERTLAIGDIHGCDAALAALLDALQPAAEDLLIVLGDFVDRGPHSRQVIERLLQLQQHCQLIVLRGNHEAMLLDGLEDEDERHFWLTFGGQATLDSYGGSLPDIPLEHLEFLRNSLRFYETTTHLFVHANYQPQLPLEHQPEVLRMWTHLGVQLPGPHVSGKTAVVGHTPQLDGEVLDLGHLICLDTFCYGGGWLTAMDVVTRQIWQAAAYGRLRAQPST